MSRDNRVGEHVDDFDRVIRSGHAADVGPVGSNAFRAAHGDRERFVDACDSLQYSAAVGVDDRDAVVAVVGDHQSAAIGAGRDATDRSVVHRNLDEDRQAHGGVEAEAAAIQAITGGLLVVHIIVQAHAGTAFAVCSSNHAGNSHRDNSVRHWRPWINRISAPKGTVTPVSKKSSG
jgi:hypothetical protein